MPVVLGHELAGVIDEVGPDVAGLSAGVVRVALEPFITCGKCEYCVADRYNLCTKAGYYGLSGRGRPVLR